MAASAATALSLAGTAAGFLGGGGETEAVPTSGYQTYPQWLKDIYENEYAPAISDNFQKEFPNMPMTRYDNYDPVFGSQSMQQLQQYSDAIGGLYTPYVDPNAAQDGGEATEEVATPQERITQIYKPTPYGGASSNNNRVMTSSGNIYNVIQDPYTNELSYEAADDLRGFSQGGQELRYGNDNVGYNTLGLGGLLDLSKMGGV